MNLDSWKSLIDHWIATGHDIQYLDIPEDITKQLNLSSTQEKDMTAEHEPLGAKWKRKKYFDGTQCGLTGCTQKPDGYICDRKPTKGSEVGRLWYGPACTKCVRKHHPHLVPMTLGELVFQRAGVSDLALVLDAEVGDVIKRLQEACIDDKGNAVDITQPPPDGRGPNYSPPSVRQLAAEEWDHTGLGERQTKLDLPAPHTALITETIPVPSDYLAAQKSEADGVVQFIAQFHVTDQRTMNLASGWVKIVKETWNQLEEQRKELGKPLRSNLKLIQEHFNPALATLKKAENALKQKITEGSQRALAAQQQALLAAQQAYQQGNPQETSLASQKAAQADVALPKGVSTRPVVCWAVENPAMVPMELCSPDPKKIQGAIDMGHRSIPGVNIWEEQQVSVRTAT
jgi:hypothetical protein